MILRSLSSPLITAFLSPLLMGEVTTVRQFRMGENDPGVTAGSAATLIRDLTASDNLVVNGSPLYSTDTPNPGSTLSLSLDGNENASTGSWHELITNFGAEVWVKPLSSGSGNRVILYSGNTSTNGWGFIQSAGPDSTFSVLLGGQTIFGTAPVVNGQWTHLAVVAGTDSMTFYVNGEAVATTNQVPAEATSDIFVGSNPDGLENFHGNVDELRIFTFDAGAFTSQDLGFVWQPPAPLQTGLEIRQEQGNMVLTWPKTIVGHRLHTGTSLTDWTPIYERNTIGDLYTLTQPITDPTRFFRLLPIVPVDAPPQLPPGQSVTLKRGDGPKTPILDTTSGDIGGLDGRLTLILDASAYYDPFAANDEPLHFSWVLAYNGESQYTGAGVTGYRTPVLTIHPGGVPNGQFSVGLIVSSGAGAKVTKSMGYFTISRSSMSYPNWRDCMGETTACPTCPCKHPHALPSTELN